MNNILITGDLVIDHYIYEGTRYSLKQSASRGVKLVKEYGGVKIYFDFQVINDKFTRIL